MLLLLISILVMLPLKGDATEEEQQQQQQQQQPLCRLSEQIGRRQDVCQVNYHQEPVLCDTTSRISRTEAELIGERTKTKGFQPVWTTEKGNESRKRLMVLVMEERYVRRSMAACPELRMSKEGVVGGLERLADDFSPATDVLIAVIVESSGIFDDYSTPSLLVVTLFRARASYAAVDRKAWVTRFATTSVQGTSALLPTIIAVIDEAARRLEKTNYTTYLAHLESHNVPRWALVLAGSLVTLVLLALHIGSRLDESRAALLHNLRRSYGATAKTEISRRASSGLTLGGGAGISQATGLQRSMSTKKKTSTMLLRSFAPRDQATGGGGGMGGQATNLGGASRRL